MARKHIAWKTVFSTENPTVRADPNRLRQVFLNLAINAMESMNDGGTITVRTGAAKRRSRNRGWIFVDVIDTGIGIPAKHLGQIFDPFFTTKNAGTGLGLTVTHKIIEDHHGRIEVDSQAEGGTTFRVLLPVGRPLPAQREKRP
jgi:signal transduction histidine kinase